MRCLAPVVAMLAGACLFGSGCAESEEPVPLEFCEGEVSFTWDPAAGVRLAAFPDDTYTRADPDTLTGLRLNLVEDVAPFLVDQPAPAAVAFEALNALDGWGTSSALYLRFDGTVSAPPTGPGTEASTSLMLLEKTGSSWRAVDYEASLLDEGTTITVRPMRPLAPQTSHALIVTTEYVAEAGGCIGPGAALQAVLEGEGGDPRLLEAVRAAGISPDEVSAATVFTTQSIIETSLAVSEDVADGAFAWSEPPTCVEEAKGRRCEGRFVAKDYRVEGVVDLASTPTPWELDVTVWLPDGEGPFPVLLYGHGLNDSRESGAALVHWFGDLNVAVVSVDALHHGTHPTASSNTGALAFFDFFAIDAASVSLDPLRLRDNLRQSTYDRLQLLELLATEPDVDGDGEPDLDMDRLGYVGISLGAIMGSELLALSGRFQVAALIVGGARFTAIVENGADYELLYLVFEEVLGHPDETSRMLPVIQTAVDAGDPVNYARHVLDNRIDLRDGSPPHVLMNAALGDTTVPRESAYCLARALDCPIVGEDRFDEGSLPVVAPPLKGNMGAGEVTAGFMQMDRATGGDDLVTLATHENGSDCAETIFQEWHFFHTWLETGVPEILDPYDALETPALSP